MDLDTIAKVQSYGFDVYMRNAGDTWLYFTDGTRLGYLQDDRLGCFTLSTVHKANRATGTGYQVERNVPNFDKRMLERCFVLAPEWVHGSDLKSVVKYRNIEQFRGENEWQAEYQLMPR